MRRSARGSHRAAIAPVVAALLFACLSCSGSTEPDNADGASAGGGKATPSPTAPPGRYRTLPEPCGAVPREVLAKLLPGTAGASAAPEGSSDEGAKDSNGGKATLTYDTDRRVGCEWSGTGDTWNRHLSIDFKRVVSYDPSVSDEEQAQEEYLQAAGEVQSPVGAKRSEPPREGRAHGKSPDGGRADSPGSRGSSGPSKEPEETSSDSASPRIVSGIGDEAFLQNRLRADAAEPHREVSIVFRKENVIVAVMLQEWSLASGQVPSSSAMQVGTHLLAQQLAKRLGEQ